MLRLMDGPPQCTERRGSPGTCSQRNSGRR